MRLVVFAKVFRLQHKHRMFRSKHLRAHSRRSKLIGPLRLPVMDSNSRRNSKPQDKNSKDSQPSRPPRKQVSECPSWANSRDSKPHTLVHNLGWLASKLPWVPLGHRVRCMVRRREWVVN